jgi:aryl-alcohol dehydrogenase-like predicted oxidoreductase
MQALPLLKGAYDRGVNTWDTANVYSNGVSEKIIAKAIKQYNIPRHKLLILTKCYAPVGEDTATPVGKFSGELGKSKDYVNQYGKITHSVCRCKGRVRDLTRPK